MHRRVGSSRGGAALAAFLLAAAFGAPPAAAVSLPFEAELRVQLSTGPHATSITAISTGVAIANGAGGPGPLTQLSLPAAAIAATNVRVPVTDPGAAPIEGFVLTVANAPGAFAIGGGGRLGGAMGLPGHLRVCLFAPCAAPPANLVVPLTPIGDGGFATATGPLNLTIGGAPWTTGTAMVPTAALGTETWTGYAHGPTSAPSSTARAGGSLLLVTPFTFSTSIAVDGPVAGFAFLTLHFVPEPGSALLVAIGLAALGRAGWRRRA